MSATPHAQFPDDRALAQLAARQHGAVSRSQLKALGFSESLIERRVSLGRLFRCGPSVYAVGHPGLSRRGRGVAALLHAGPGAALSHETAARVWQLVGRDSSGPIHVSVPSRSTLVAPPGVVIHRPRSLAPTDVVFHRDLWLTTPERALRDLLPGRSVAQVTRMLEQMVTVLNRSPDTLHEWGHGLRNAPGRATLLRALDEVAGPAVIRSEFETRFRSLCQEAGLPSATTNHRIGRWELDAVWLEHGVAVELDSYRWHGGRWQFHRDRRKGLAISRAGFELIRLSWPQLKYDRAEVVEAIRYALQRGQSRSPHLL